MRTFRCIKPIAFEYITVGVEYTLNSQNNGTVYYCRNQKEVCCSSMPIVKFKRCLREGSIVFTD